MDTPTDALEAWVRSFCRHLAAENKSPNTIATYSRSARDFAAWLRSPRWTKEWAADRLPAAATWEEVTRDHVRAWVSWILQHGAAGYANNRYRGVQAFFKFWADEEGAPNPMLGMSPPSVPDKVVPIIPDDTLRALFRCCAGRDLIDRRDLAILRLFASSGVRLAEMAGLRSEDIDLDNRLALVTGKGSRQRIVRFDHDTARALDRYLRERAKEKYAHRPELWLAEKNKGPLKRNGIYQMVVRRGAMVGADINPHQFRHTFAHKYRAAGGEGGDLMELTGWRSPQMLVRYGASARAERAQTAYDRLDIMGKL